jgi:hypothetical protein
VIDIGIDESLSPPSPKLVVSAIVGNTARMRKLDTEWKRDLADSRVDYFHAKDHWNTFAKPYHGISTERRRNLLGQLVGHIHHRFLFAVSAIVDQAEYRSHASERFRSQYGSPYGFAFQMLMTCIFVELTKQRRENQPVNILIEDGHKNSEQAIGFIAEKKKREGGLTIASHGVGGKRDNPILQAADMLAFGVCEFHAKGYSDFAARLAPPKFRTRIFELPWNKSSVEAVKSDIVRNISLKKSNAPGSKRLSELVMW